MLTTPSHLVRVAVVGIGNVGATFAYSLMLSGLATEIVLIDSNFAKAEGEAMDMNHAVPLTQPVRVYAGTYADCAGAAVTVITAGSAQKPGETRLDLVQRNAAILKSVVESIMKYNPTGMLLIASNPVDVLAYAAWRYSGLPWERVIGSGTILDTARFRYLLSEYFKVDPRSVHANIIGEHGDSEVAVWSLANIGGMRLADFCAANDLGCRDEDLDAILDQTRNAAYAIIERKGATYYAIAVGLTRIVEAILKDQRTVLTVSSHIQDYYGIRDVYLSLPSVIHHGGVEKVLHLNLAQEEIAGLQRSAEVLKSTIREIGL